MDIKEKLKMFVPKHDFFIGVDHDGCTFNTMEMKHKMVFIPLAVKIWGLEQISEAFTEVAEFVNLYSDLRGTNRFLALALTFLFLKERKDISGHLDIIPDFSALDDFVHSGLSMSNTSLVEYMKGNDASFLKDVLKWSEDGDNLLEELNKDNPPYHYVKEAMAQASNKCDVIIISSASQKALEADWTEYGLMEYAAVAAGQEAGSKAQQLKLSAVGKYKKGNMLMIGDALGDYNAARENDILFYPINPGHEVDSWKRFFTEAYDKFITDQYAGAYEESLLIEFMTLQPTQKPWESK